MFILEVPLMDGLSTFTDEFAVSDVSAIVPEHFPFTEANVCTLESTDLDTIVYGKMRPTPGLRTLL